MNVTATRSTTAASRVSCVMNEIIENAAQSFWIEQQLHFGNGLFEFERGGFEGEFGTDFLHQLANEFPVIHRRKDHARRAAHGEFENLANQIADALDLFADADLRLLAEFGRALLHAGHLGRDADDVQRVLQVMNDGTGKTTDHGQPLRLQDLTEVLSIELTQALADFPQQPERECRRLLDQPQHLLRRNEVNGGRLSGDRARRTRLVVQHSHFAEDVTGLHG